jgi:hypothetical protein
LSPRREWADPYLLGLCVLVLGKKLVGKRCLQNVSLDRHNAELDVRAHLESSSKTEDTVVGLLLGKTLEGQEDLLGLFGDQIIGSV